MCEMLCAILYFLTFWVLLERTLVNLLAAWYRLGLLAVQTVRGLRSSSRQYPQQLSYQAFSEAIWKKSSEQEAPIGWFGLMDVVVANQSKASAFE
jgi:hypothetical protein